MSAHEDGGRSRSSDVLRAFFNRGVAVALRLPDRWFGDRPMENQHDLTYILERPGRLIIELDERVLLTFTGEEVTVRATTTDVLDRMGTPALEIANYAQFVLDVRLYGSEEVEAAVYRTGSVLLVSSA